MTDKMSILNESVSTIRPLPNEFSIYLPWACNQLEMEQTVIVNKIYQSEYLGSVSEHSKPRSKIKAKPRPLPEGSTDRSDMKTIVTQQVSFADDAIRVIGVYDLNEEVIQIIINNNKKIPRVLLEVIGLIIKFHPHISSVMINQGADYGTLHELNKILPLSNITEICLDGCPINGGNYQILLEHECLRQLSLRRCQISDDYINEIAAKLTYPLPASKSLAILNLTSNRITDVGAKYLGRMLRSNRCLSYLNLSGNWITDDGAAEILNSLQEFCLTPEEALSSKALYLSYLQKKNELIAVKLKEMREGDLEKTPRKKTRRSTPTSVRKKNRPEREGSFQSARDGISINISDSYLLERVLPIVQASLGDFNGPFSSNNTSVKNEALFCLGNNTLCCLNLAYNNLSYLILNKLLHVLTYQKQADRKPSGLIYVCIDGNNLPKVCEELRLINQILESGVHRGTTVVKRQKGKTGK